MTYSNDEIKQKIKQSISFIDKFREYYPEKYMQTGNSLSPFRKDVNPSLQLHRDHAFDFGTETSYDIFDLYMLKYGCDFKTAFAALKAEAGLVDPPKKSRKAETNEKVFDPFKDGQEVVAYDYPNETNPCLYQNVRFEPKNPSEWPKGEKTFLHRRPDPNKEGQWIWNLKGITPVPFKLPELLAAPKDQPVFITEGEKDTLAMTSLGFAATSVGSASTGCGTLEKHGAVKYFTDRDIIVIADKDENGRKYAQKAAAIYATVAKSVKIIEMPGEGIKDPADLVERNPGGAKDIILATVKLAKPYTAPVAKAEQKKKQSTKGAGDKSEKLTKFQKLNQCFQELGWTLFFDQNGQPWASVKINGHHENLPVSSEQFQRLFQKEYKAQYDDGVGPRQIDQVTGALLGEIEKFQSPRSLHVRMAWNVTKDKILIDSGRPDWAVYEIGPDGWCMIQTDENPFKRARKTAPYGCTPDTDRAKWDNLFEFLRVTNDNQKTIIKMWLCLALFPDTARPGLVITGPAGSAKTTVAVKLKRLVDPATNERPNRFTKNEEDMIAPLAGYAITVLDNANQMTPEQSDLLCQSIYGVAPDKRKKFTDGDIYSMDFMVSWIITGINNPGKLSDFLSRVFLLETELIPEDQKIPDGKIDELAAKYTPGIQALIFDCMSAALKNINSIKSEKLHRLAQANLYSLAMADALGLTQEQIASVWNANREEQQAEVSSGEILTELIPEWLEINSGKWQGSPSQHHDEMYSELEIDKRSYKKSFPNSAVHLTRRLNTIIENLSERNIKTINRKKGGQRFRQIYDTTKYKENPFELETTPDPNKVVPIKRDLPIQPPLPQQIQMDADLPGDQESTNPCDKCSQYQGNDLCGLTDITADPENCSLLDTGLKQVGNNEPVVPF